MGQNLKYVTSREPMLGHEFLEKDLGELEGSRFHPELQRVGISNEFGGRSAELILRLLQTYPTGRRARSCPIA